MPILNLLVALIVVGVLLWLVNSFIPMADSIKSILNPRCYCRGFVAPERFWTSELAFQTSRVNRSRFECRK